MLTVGLEQSTEFALDEVYLWCRIVDILAEFLNNFSLFVDLLIDIFANCLQPLSDIANLVEMLVLLLNKLSLGCFHML
jgi:hypothetical protein